MIKYIEKRDGSIAKFNPKNIYNAVYQSAKSCNEFVDVDNVVRLVTERLEKRNQPTINIEIVQDEVEFVLMGLGYFKVAKSYITYRNMRDAQRNLSLGNINAESSVEEYLSRADWRVNANANQGYSLGGMILNVAGKVTANYWLNKIYPKEIGQAHRNGDIHIHDLDMLSIYCCGWSLKNVLREGMNGIAGKIESNPPKHLSSALNQALNHLCCCQNEAAGAQAYSSFDTYMAPYIRIDNLSYKEVKQHLQEFIYNLNVPSRWGCVPTSTEVLTTDGWKDSYTLSMKDKVYSINKRGELCLSTIKRIIHKKNASKKLIAFRNDHYNYEQLVTPEHRVLVGRTQLSKLDDLKIKRAENISGITNLPVAFTNSIIEDSSPSNEEVMMAAALYCDGSWYYKEKVDTPRVFYFKSPNRQKDSWFEKLCKKLGVVYKKKKVIGDFGSTVNKYVFHSDSARKLTKLVGRKTRIDEKFLNMNREKSQLFLDTWMAHDGQEEKHILQFDTLAIAKGLQHIAVNACKTSSIVKIHKSQYVKLRGVEMLGVKQIQQIDYDGEVWCPSLTMGTAIFRDKNGGVFISGQTQTPFTNLTFDWVCPEDLKKEKPVVGGKECDFFYGDLQKEMDMINKAYIEIMLEGDKNGRVFTFPIPTYNMTKEFDWDSENSTLLFEMTAKYGLPYFQNFINSELKPNMIRSMCCRLQLDLRELLKRGNGLFGSAEQTGCYDEETEVLTRQGWKFWKDVTMEDEFCTLSRSRKIEYQRPIRLFKKKYSGKMIHFNTRNLDLKVTPNHNMLIENQKGELSLIRADKYAFSSKIYHNGIPKRGIWLGKKQDLFELKGIEGTKCCFGHEYPYTSPDRTFDTKDWMAFLGIFLSEGWYSKIKNRNKDYLFIISQKKPHVRKQIKELFKRMGIHYNEKIVKNGFGVHCKTLHSYLKQFGLQKVRFIPREVLELDKEYLEILYHWLMLGDGSVSKNGQETYYTCSKQLASDVQELIIKLGYGSRITTKDKLYHGKINRIYEVSKHVKSDKYWIQTHKKIEVEDYCGKIYCAEVPNHTLMVRRNGKATWCGNSIGVVTINCARLGYLFKGDKESLYNRLDYLMDLARNSLELKRKTLKQNMDRGLYPYIKRWLGTLRNHFSTIGVNGINEMIRNFTNDKEDITTEKGHAFAVEFLDHVRAKLLSYQSEQGTMYNLEATPAEGTTYRFAKEDKKRFPDIIQAGTPSNPYYTNSSQLPVGYTDDPFEALELQDDLQRKYTGGCCEEGTDVLTDKGIFKIEKLVEDFEKLKPIKVISFNEKTKVSEWKEIDEVYKIDVSSKDKIRVKGENNFEIVTSDWHPFFVSTKKKLASNVCPVCGEAFDNYQGRNNHLAHNPKCREKYHSIKEKVSKERPIIQKRADELVVMDKLIQNSTNLLVSQTPVSKELAYILGFFIGNGYLASTTYKLSFYSGKKDNPLDYLCECLKKEFGIIETPEVWEPTNPNCIEVRITGKEKILPLRKSFEKFGFKPGKKTYTISANPIIPYLDKNNFPSFLSGLLDSDGYIDQQGDGEYATVSTSLYDSLVYLFTMTGINLRIKYRKSKKANEKDFYSLYLKKKYLMKYFDELSPTLQRALILGILKEPKKERQEEVIRVKEVSKTQVSNNQFYDLNIRDNHNYLAGKNGSFVFVHNTVLHLYMNEAISSSDACKKIVKRALTNFKLPYITITPTFSICPIHGYIKGQHEYCPKCDAELLAKKANK
jgi:ribonucleoside-triphosphate reductase